MNMDNFNFFVKLSDFSLTLYDIYEVLDAILNDLEKKGIEEKSEENDDESLPKVYAFVKKYFNEKINSENYAPLSSTSLPHSSSSILANIKQFNPNSNAQMSAFCVLLHFGIALSEDLPVDHSEFRNFARLKSDDDCPSVLYKQRNYDHAFVMFTLTRFAPIELELFSEVISNYTNSITINSNKWTALAQFSDAALKSVRLELFSSVNTENFSHKMMDKLKVVLRLLEGMDDKESYAKLNKQITNLTEANVQKHSLIELMEVLHELIDDYSCAHFYPKHEDTIKKFGPILFEGLKKSHTQVEYDEKSQNLSFPSSVAEYFLHRIQMLIQKKGATLCQIGDQFDFVKTLENIASVEKLELTKERRKTISAELNSKLFKLFFALAFRLSMQIEKADLAKQYTKSFAIAYKCIKNQNSNDSSESTFLFKINNNNGRMWLNLPNWKLPNYIYSEIENKLIEEKAEENFQFWLSFINYSPTPYEILKMAEKLGNVQIDKAEENDHLLIGQSDPKIFTEFMKYVKSQSKQKESWENEMKTEFCILAHFVEELMEEIVEKKEIPLEEEQKSGEGKPQKGERGKPSDESEKNMRESDQQSVGVKIGRLILARENFCKPNEFVIEENIQENLLSFFHVITIEYDPRKNLQQIIPQIIAEINKMLENCEWNFVNFFYTNIIEWNLLKFYLNRIGKDAKFEKIDKLRKIMEEMFGKGYFQQKDEEKTAEDNEEDNFKEVVGKMIKALRQILEEDF